MKGIYMGLLIWLLGGCTAFAEEYRVSHFSTEGLAGWETKTFKEKTIYTLIKENGTTVVRAQSRSSASALYRKVKLDPLHYRYLRWSWKVAGVINKGQENSKAGDDFAARVYVVFPGHFFWQTRAINYIWANHLSSGSSFPSPFTRNAIMLAVESGQANVGQWLTEERDILNDYRHLFGEDPHEIGAIAFMTDTDNTGEEATAWYGDLSISSEK
jgi:hypothetical protein